MKLISCISQFRTEITTISYIMPPPKDNFQPKQSKHMPKDVQNLKGDGDQWVERFVYDNKGRKRAFFQSVKTDECHWDEPPTGASRLIFASELHKYPSLAKYRSASAPPSSQDEN